MANSCSRAVALEIERRFLVAGDAWRAHVRWSRHLQQGYLSRPGEGLTVRVRVAEQAGEPAQAWLTLKAPPLAAPSAPAPAPSAPAAPEGLVRLEFEYPIPPADAAELLRLGGPVLSKWRHGLDLPGGDWVLDVFEQANAPLLVAEVELPRVDQACPVPPWCVLELTGRHELSNAALSQRPFQAWSAAEQRPLLQLMEAA